MQKFRVLILGSGGREHTLAWKIAGSVMLEKLFISPGNGGTYPLSETININPLDFIEVAGLIKKEKIDILVVGPEEPLVKGISDFLRNDTSLSNLIIVGPSAKGAQLEGSKAWSKQFMQKYNIPTAKYKSFGVSDFSAAEAFLKTLSPPYVIKASGLAAGKGVIITEDLNEAFTTVGGMLNGSFGDAGKEVVIEEFLSGIEVSVFVLTDGKNFAVLPEAKDYKRIGDNNTGPNTGGMGAVSPVPFANSNFMEKVKSRIIEPTISGLVSEGIDYKGFIFFGLINVKGEPLVIEYNVRMGDPETQAVLPRLNNDLLELFTAMHNNNIDKIKINVSKKVSLSVVLASGGYPGNYEKGFEISVSEKVEGTEVFHAGTARKDGKLISSGGRVMTVTALDDNIVAARERAYKAAGKINFFGRYFRNDIGKDLI